MFFMLKFFISFAISFVILSFPLPRGTLFTLIHSQTNQYTQSIYKSISLKVQSGVETGSYYTKKIFSNSEPTLQDQVFSKFSSTKKKNYLHSPHGQTALEGKDHEKFTDEEKERLNKVLRETH